MKTILTLSLALASLACEAFGQCDMNDKSCYPNRTETSQVEITP